MRRFIMRAYATVAAGVVLGIGGVAGASASAAAPQALPAVRVSPEGTAHATVSPGTQLWAKLYNANGEFHHANAVAVSPNGNTVFVTGTSGKAGSTVTDYATIAYNTATGAQQWTKLYQGPGGGGCNFDNAVAVSPDGNTVFVTGECGGPSTAEYATVAYSAATGAQKWVKLYNGAGTLNYANSLAVSPNGKTVYVTGQSDSKSFVPQYATVAYNAATGAQLWAKRHSGIQVSANGYRNSLAVSPTGGAVYVTGIYGDANATGAGYDTIAYNAATGAQLWAKRYNGREAGGLAVAVSPNGNTVFVTGKTFTSPRGFGYATVAYNAATGAQLWAKSHVGAVGAAPSALAYSVAVSPSGGTVYVTGLSWKPPWAYATIAYNAATGAQKWIKLYTLPSNGSTDGQVPVSAAVSPTTGTVVVTGATLEGEWATVAYSG